MILTEINPTQTDQKISEQDKQKFIKRNNFFCKELKISISQSACETFQRQSTNLTWNHPLSACQECKKFKKSLLKKQPVKQCKLHANFPNQCLGTGKFKKRPDQSQGVWDIKMYCTLRCGVRHNVFIKRGWEVEGDLNKYYSGMRGGVKKG